MTPRTRCRAPLRSAMARLDAGAGARERSGRHAPPSAKDMHREASRRAVVSCPPRDFVHAAGTGASASFIRASRAPRHGPPGHVRGHFWNGPGSGAPAATRGLEVKRPQHRPGLGPPHPEEPDLRPPPRGFGCRGASPGGRAGAPSAWRAQRGQKRPRLARRPAQPWPRSPRSTEPLSRTRPPRPEGTRALPPPRLLTGGALRLVLGGPDLPLSFSSTRS
jgi:hypothetical protein